MPYDTNTTAPELVTDYTPFIEGKTIFITGVSPGSLGDFYSQSIAKAKPASLILADRNPSKLEQCAREIHTNNSTNKIKTLD